ncbi:exodeoxyribonuclease VII small subunit [Legionella worsleiensis]|uniref:Exodeoxyribonuclease 7 small subunit n=1 Tax=Legionella worsleiensis TaxID=45076 RepID=A0A0W1AHA3_9GAMM|nr:exodeoxyribonuclease VII small subunit [Legionella worsleiensis]KTD80743.1 exodeoxyribonuclease VII small subunit [Legionella worsleiensis]STY32679.1 exodeoxyribonuclease VII small subunit [Legionella worsleiensis]
MTKGINFEQSVSELEEIVKQLEKGELSLEDSLKQFEKGIGLARRCQDVLNQAEQKIETLTAYHSSEPKPDEHTSD